MMSPLISKGTSGSRGTGFGYHNGIRAIGYVRVSTEKQADLGVSVDAQAAKIRAMAAVRGADMADVIVDAGESVKSLERPGIARLLAFVVPGIITATHRDRRGTPLTRRDDREY